MTEDALERIDGPFHDGEQCFDSTYSDGTWDTLTFMGQRMMLIGLKIGPFDLKHQDGTRQRLQGNMLHTMVRDSKRSYILTIGGGD